MIVFMRTNFAQSNVDQRWESSGSMLQFPPARKPAGFDATRSVSKPTTAKAHKHYTHA